MTMCTLWAKNLVKTALSCTISERNVFLHFTQNFKMAAKKDRKAIFGKKVPHDSGGQIFHRNHSILHYSPDKCVFAFYA